MRLITDDDISLEEFAQRFLDGNINWQNVPRDGVTYFGVVLSMVLYRKGQFQVELVITPHEDAQITKHRHPNVDSIEFPLAGDGQMFVDDKPIFTELQKKLWKKNKLPGVLISVPHTSWHFGSGKVASAFLSIQHWLNGITPKNSVGLDWEGSFSSDAHEALVRDSIKESA
jgi:hypothetical protein